MVDHLSRVTLAAIQRTVPNHAVSIPGGLRGTLSPLAAVLCAIVAGILVLGGTISLSDPEIEDRSMGVIVLLLAVAVLVVGLHFWTSVVDVTDSGVASRSLVTRPRLVTWRKRFDVGVTDDGRFLRVEQGPIVVRLSWLYGGYGELRALLIQACEDQERQPNQALQTTSVTRSGFGKVPVSDRQRRGV